jgi:FkbM family methyltransferase
VSLPAASQTPVSLLRRLAEHAARNLVVRRRLPADFGHRAIFLSPANRLRALDFSMERFEPSLLSYTRRFVRPGMVVWDIGANMGAFTFPAAHAVGAGKVVAIEPDPFNQLLLHRTQAANPDLPVTIIPAALSDQVGLADLQIAVRGRAANSLRGADHGSQMGGVRTAYPVVTVTLDWLGEHQPAPDLIKCDAEGAEAWILRGGAKLLATKRPVLIMEVPSENSEACTAILHDHHYRLFPAEQRIDQAKELRRIGQAWEIVAIPSESVAGWKGV